MSFVMQLSLYVTVGLRTAGFWKHKCGRERDYLEELNSFIFYFVSFS